MTDDIFGPIRAARIAAGLDPASTNERMRLANSIQGLHPRERQSLYNSVGVGQEGEVAPRAPAAPAAPAPPPVMPPQAPPLSLSSLPRARGKGAASTPIFGAPTHTRYFGPEEVPFVPFQENKAISDHPEHPFGQQFLPGRPVPAASPAFGQGSGITADGPDAIIRQLFGGTPSPLLRTVA